MRARYWLIAVLWPGVAVADGEGHRAPPPAAIATPVIGGTAAPAGTWPDAAAVLYPDGTGASAQGCTGVLVAPTVVLTAGHCWDPATVPPLVPDSVLVGTSSLAHPSDGETIAVTRGIPYPDASTTEDLTVLVLARASRFAPRAIATGWVRFDIANGASVALVGYGAVDRDGTMFVDELQQGVTTITDFDCTAHAGCHPAAMPDGELGAGGMGVDTCPGDSGGPLYLTASYGAFLAGITSRAYSDAVYACSGGGIYTRPDKLVDWIEQQAGVPIARGPEPTADPIDGIHGDGAETLIATNDPATADHTFAVTSPPAHGTARVRDDGRVRVCLDPETTGSDSITVTVTDSHVAARTLALTIPITIEAGMPAGTCSVDAFSVGETGGGCCDAGGGGPGAWSLSIAVLAILRRRR